MGNRENVAGSQAELPFASVETPRLRILHLMLWTLCSAVYLTLIRAIYALQGDMPNRYVAIQHASSVVRGIITGAVLTGAIVLVSTRVRTGPPMLRQPGHWLLFISAILNLIQLPLLILVLLLQDFASSGTFHYLIYGVVFLFPPIAYSVAARHSRARRWKILFVALAAVSLTYFLYFLSVALSIDGRFGYGVSIFASIPTWGSLLLAAAVLVVSLADWMAGRRYDWLHWTGVTTHVMAASLTMLWMVTSWFVR